MTERKPSVRVSVMLRPGDLAAIDSLAAFFGESRAEMVRRTIRYGAPKLERIRELEKDRMRAEGVGAGR